MIISHFRMARKSIRSSRLRSFLTVVGIVIGIASVVTVASLGEGVKNNVTSEINRLGDSRLSIRPGQSIERDANGRITGINIASTLGASTLTEEDITDIAELPEVETAVPIALLAGTPVVDGKKNYANAYVAATTSDLPTVLDKGARFGSFFEDSEKNRNLAIIGSNVAIRLFEDESPIGQTLKIRGNEFVVRGVLENFKSSGFEIFTSYNDAIFIPLDTAKRISGGVLEVRNIEVLLRESIPVGDGVSAVKKSLLENHSNQEDFTIFRQEDLLSVTSQAFSLLTAFVAAVAGISLFVGGIGVMNIMLVSVTERTREIGIRKALGATNKQILGQFLIEAIVLCGIGGFFGLVVSGGVSVLIAVFSPITPAFTPGFIAIALGVSMSVGVIFGITPALKAARKDPIEALRYE